jgi:hypothetical protein
MDTHYTLEIPDGISEYRPGCHKKRRGRPKIKWDREVERVMKLKNATTADAVNW